MQDIFIEHNMKWGAESCTTVCAVRELECFNKRLHNPCALNMQSFRNGEFKNVTLKTFLTVRGDLNIEIKKIGIFALYIFPII